MKLLVSSYYKSSNINGFSFAEHRHIDNIGGGNLESRKRTFIHLSEGKTVEPVKGLFRTTLAYNDRIMLCHFVQKKDTVVALHSHKAAQNGYIIKGRLKFINKDGESFIAETGCGYAFDSEELHGSVALEDTEFVESFAPIRPEYID
ncbi:MAG TPA: cupin domain-containing protein [Clostridiaceae bacterium]|nr:cupin domain-containing protein [Clostridiaceae bacterium]